MDTIPNNLPLQLTSFIGREREIAEVKRLLSHTALLTLTGSGGTGKTRLSLQVATDLLDAFKDGVWFVELAPLADPTLIPQTVAAVFGLREDAGRPLLAALSEHLRAKQLLLVLDNCEHLIEASARLADALLHTAPALKILASSREALGIGGEATYHVPSLPAPDPKALPSGADLRGYDAIQLFVERARAVKSTFALEETNAPAVVQICYRLDGIPLAIELAAARIKVFAPQQIAERLDDRFRLLTGGSRTALPRQQTLRGAIDWSHSLLSEPERVLLSRLSVFAGGWSFEAVEAVCADDRIGALDVLDLLTRLVDKSLVVEDDAGGKAHYHLLETIRQYARDKLMDSGATAQVRARHLAYFSHEAVSYDVDRSGQAATPWFEKVGSDIDNFRTALDWSLESGDILPGLLIAGELHWYWWLNFPAEGLERLRKFLSRAEAQEHTAARAQALFGAGYIQTFVGNPTSARRSLEEALAISKEIGSERLAAAALVLLGGAANGLREYEAANAYLTEGLDVARRISSPFWIGTALQGFGDVALRQGDLDRAQAAFEETVTVIKPLGEWALLPLPLRRLGLIALRRGEYERALKLIHESLVLNQKGNDRRGIACCLAALAAVCAARGDTLAAIRVCGAVDAMLAMLHTSLVFLDQDAYEHTVATLRTQLAPAAFEAAWAEGRALTFEQAVATGWAILSESAPAAAPAPEPPHSSAYAAGLTAREVEVLRLLAQGLTDAQIAEQLVLSTRTVNAHLRSIYSKLDVTTRTAAVRAAQELHLV